MRKLLCHLGAGWFVVFGAVFVVIGLVFMWLDWSDLNLESGLPIFLFVSTGVLASLLGIKLLSLKLQSPVITGTGEAADYSAEERTRLRKAFGPVALRYRRHVRVAWCGLAGIIASMIVELLFRSGYPPGFFRFRLYCVRQSFWVR